MSGSAPSNSQAVDFEKQQAAEADQKEALRQQRLQQGTDIINNIFGGGEVMGTKSSNFDWSSFDGSNAPSGYTAIQLPSFFTDQPQSGALPTSGQAPATRTTGAAAPSAPTTMAAIGGRGDVTNAAGPKAATGATATKPPAMQWALKDAQGNIINPGTPLSISSTYDTGQKSEGFGDSFFNAYKQKYLDYYQPQEQRQYQTAGRDLLYSLDRQGGLNSSVQADKQGDLAYNDALAKATIVNGANDATGQLRDQIQSNKTSLINQLYATEDPSLTADLAQSSANATALKDPTMTPLASLFTPAMSTVGSAVNGLLYPQSPYGSNTGSPKIADASASSGGGYRTG